MRSHPACEAVIHRHSRSFSLAARMLPAAARRDAVALYAWCRNCDDAVDVASSSQAAAENLQRLSDELDAVYENRSFADPVLAEFQQTVQRCEIPRQYADDLLAGMAFDVHYNQVETPEQLLTYCYQVAGTVGLMMAHVLEVRDDAALPHAAHLGMGMQLTNICRDVREDAARGRCYLPAVWLQGRAATDDDNARPLVQRLLAAAERLYASGDAGLAYLKPRCRWAVAAARHVYAAIGHRVARQGYRVSQPRAVVSSMAKLGLIARAGWQAMQFGRAGATHRPSQQWTFEPAACARLVGWDSAASLENVLQTPRVLT